MAFSDTTVPYEILIRFSDNGTPKGGQVQWRRIVEIDGERLKDDLLPAEPLALDGFPTSDIMNQATQSALVRIADLEGQLAEVHGQLGAANEALAAASAQAITE